MEKSIKNIRSTDNDNGCEAYNKHAAYIHSLDRWFIYREKAEQCSKFPRLMLHVLLPFCLFNNL